MPQVEYVFKHASYAAAAIIAIVVLLRVTGIRWRLLDDRHSWPLVGWCLLAMVGPGVLLDAYHIQRSGWTIHFAIRCIAIFVVLALMIRDANHRKKKPSASGGR